jgi:hypothetical protein
MTETLVPPADRLRAGDVDLQIIRRRIIGRSRGCTILFLHGFHPLDPDARLLEHLSRKAFVLPPFHPDFGPSFTGCLAAALAPLGSPRLNRLVLADALALKLGDRESPDILDIFNSPPDALADHILDSFDR